MTFGMGGTGIWDNAHEFIHRPFVWAYWLVGSLTAGRLFFHGGRTLSATMDHGALLLALSALTLVPVGYGSGLQPGKVSGGECVFQHYM